MTTDDTAFAAVLDRARGELDAEPVEGSLSLKGGKVTLKEPVTGTRTDAERTAEAVRRAWPGRRTVAVVAEQVPPAVAAEELARVRTEFADLAVSGPVTVRVGEKSFSVAPRTFAPGHRPEGRRVRADHPSRRREEAVDASSTPPRRRPGSRWSRRTRS